MTTEPAADGAPGNHGSLRAAAADRERAVDVLKAAFAEGRLTKDEFEARAERAYQSRTYADLLTLTGDLPAGPLGTPAPGGGHPGGGHLVTPASQRTNSLAVCALICALLPGIPPLAAIPVGLAARRRIRQTGERGSGIAAAAILIGSLELLLLIVLVTTGVVHI